VFALQDFESSSVDDSPDFAAKSCKNTKAGECKLNSDMQKIGYGGRTPSWV